MNPLTAEQQLKEMQEKMEAVMKENESLREIAAIKQSEALLNEEIEALKREIEALGEEKRQQVEVDKLKKQLYDIKNADKPNSLVDNAPQFSLDSLPEDSSELEIQVRMHMDRQLLGRNIGKTDERNAERYVEAMTRYIKAWRMERDSWQVKSTGKMPVPTQRAAEDAEYMARVALKIKPIVNLSQFNRP